MFFFLFLLTSLTAGDEATQARENIRKALQVETEIALKEENWQKEKARLLQEKELLKLKADELKKEIQTLEGSIKKIKDEAQLDLDVQKDLTQKHQAVVKDLKDSVAKLSDPSTPAPEDENLKQILKSLQSQSASEDLNPSVLFDQLNDFHSQWWQMGQSFQIKTGNISIENKEYHGEIIRLGLIYQFLLFQDNSRWAYFDAKEKKWKFGRVEETSKLIKIKNILQKKEPSQLVELPGK